MRHDLLEAQASVNWAASNFPAFQNKLQTWLDENISVGIKELDNTTPNNLIIATQKNNLPLEFNAEFGAYANAMRSALDLIAMALANRHGIAPTKNICFPVANSQADFLAGKGFKGNEFVKTLPTTERTLLEKLSPYKGGNQDIWLLHKLDIVRKHYRLLAVKPQPARINIVGSFRRDDLKPINSSDGFLTLGEETVLFLISKTVVDPLKLNFSAEVFVREPDEGFRAPVMVALNNWATIVNKVIKTFDY